MLIGDHFLFPRSGWCRKKEKVEPQVVPQVAAKPYVIRYVSHNSSTEPLHDNPMIWAIGILLLFAKLVAPLCLTGKERN